MNVQVNAKAAAARIKGFMNAHGGDAQHSEILELVAGVCGFDSYRAMKAFEDQSAPSNAVVQVAPVDGRPLETAERVVFRTSTTDWQLAQNPNISLDEVPQERRKKYDVIVEDEGHALRVLVKPEGIGLDNFQGHPVLDMLIEINEGLPCVHMTNDPADSMVLTVFATAAGLLARPDDSELMPTNDLRAPEMLRDLARAVCHPEELSETTLLVLDTAEKYRENDVPALLFGSTTPAASSRTPARTFPHARTSLVQTVSRKHVDAYVTVEYELSGAASGMLNASVKLFDAEGVCGDEDGVLMPVRLTAGASDQQLKQLADNVAQLTAFFVEAGYSMTDLRRILEEIAFDDNAPVQSGLMLKEALDADTRSDAYELVTALMVG